MKVVGLDGKEYQLSMIGHKPLGTDPRFCSRGHKRARKLLEKLFPCENRFEEVPLPGSSGLYADFFLPNKKLMVEVHGTQHYRFVAHFHKTMLGFLKHQERDRMKHEWCERNGIAYCELPDDERDDKWTERIRTVQARPAGQDS